MVSDMKNITSLEQFAAIDTFVFDKTGTISSSQKSHIAYEGEALTEKDLGIFERFFQEFKPSVKSSIVFIFKFNTN